MFSSASPLLLQWLSRYMQPQTPQGVAGQNASGNFNSQGNFGAPYTPPRAGPPPTMQWAPQPPQSAPAQPGGAGGTPGMTPQGAAGLQQLWKQITNRGPDLSTAGVGAAGPSLGSFVTGNSPPVGGTPGAPAGTPIGSMPASSGSGLGGPDPWAVNPQNAGSSPSTPWSPVAQAGGHGMGPPISAPMQINPMAQQQPNGLPPMAPPNTAGANGGGFNPFMTDPRFANDPYSQPNNGSDLIKKFMSQLFSQGIGS